MWTRWGRVRAMTNEKSSTPGVDDTDALYRKEGNTPLHVVREAIRDVDMSTCPHPPGAVSTLFEPIDWEARLQAAVAKTLQQRRVKLAERAMFAERRNHGLKARHAQKLAQIKNQQTKEQP